MSASPSRAAGEMFTFVPAGLLVESSGSQPQSASPPSLKAGACLRLEDMTNASQHRQVLVLAAHASDSLPSNLCAAVDSTCKYMVSPWAPSPHLSSTTSGQPVMVPPTSWRRCMQGRTRASATVFSQHHRCTPPLGLQQSSDMGMPALYALPPLPAPPAQSPVTPAALSVPRVAC